MNQVLRKPEKPIAIHDDPGSFSKAWVAYCEANNIPYMLVNCYDSDIVHRVSQCSGLLWHWHHNDPAAAKFARQLAYSLEARGIPMYPNSRTAWHFDDKVGQKYLFEALDVPHVPSYAFYRRKDAFKFIAQSDLPVVFKLTRGAGSKNVALVETNRQGKSIIRRSFGRGWADRYRTHALSQGYRQLRNHRNLKGALSMVKGLVRFVYPHSMHRQQRVEAAYAYFQDFVPDNDSDIRIIVIGGKAVGFRRLVSDGDFRASGSGYSVYDPEEIPIEAVRVAFNTATKIGMQSAAFDFVMSGEEPLVVEVSYGFGTKSSRHVPGYWDRCLQWHSHNGPMMLEEMILEEFLSEIVEESN